MEGKAVEKKEETNTEAIPKEAQALLEAAGLTEIQFKSERSNQIDQLFAALAKAQSDFELAERSKKVDFPTTKNSDVRVAYSYADLAILIKASRPHLAKSGLCVTQLPSLGSGGVRLITILGHSSGQYIQTWLGLNSPSTDPKALGATVTYARRIAYAAITGVVAVDEDEEPEDVSGADTPEEAKAKEKAKADSVQKTDKYSKIGTGKPIPLATAKASPLPSPAPAQAPLPATAPAQAPKTKTPVEIARHDAYAAAQKAFGANIEQELTPLLAGQRLAEMTIEQAADLKALIEVRFEQILSEQEAKF